MIWIWPRWKSVQQLLHMFHTGWTTGEIQTMKFVHMNVYLLMWCRPSVLSQVGGAVGSARYNRWAERIREMWSCRLWARCHNSREYTATRPFLHHYCRIYFSINRYESIPSFGVSMALVERQAGHPASRTSAPTVVMICAIVVTPEKIVWLNKSRV